MNLAGVAQIVAANKEIIMPLVKGHSRKVVSQNISEFHHGKTYAHTAAKFGKAKANAQAVAVAMSSARKHPHHSRFQEGATQHSHAHQCSILTPKTMKG